MSDEKEIDQSFSYDADDSVMEDLPPAGDDDDSDFYGEDGLDDRDDGEDGEDGDWENYDALADDNADDEKKKKSKRLNMIIIGGAAVVGLGVMYMNATGGGSAPAPAPAQMAQQIPSGPAAIPTHMDVVYGKTSAMQEFERDTQEQSLPTPGFMNDPAALDRLTDIRDQIEFDDQALPPPGRPAPGGSSALPREIEGDLPMPSPIGPMEAEGAVLTPLPGSGSAPSALPPPVQDQAPPASARLPRADAIMKKADPAPSNVPVGWETGMEPIPAPAKDPSAALSPGAPPPATANPAIAAQIDDLSTRLKAIERRLATIEKGTVSKAEIESLADAIDTVRAQAGTAPPATSSPTRSAPSRPRPAAAQPAPAARQAASPRWVLKSAQPGRAMVSPSGKNEMRNVVIGDNLPGIGRITGVFQENGRWIVQGTNGRITQ